MLFYFQKKWSSSCFSSMWKSVALATQSAYSYTFFFKHGLRAHWTFSVAWHGSHWACKFIPNFCVMIWTFSNQMPTPFIFKRSSLRTVLLSDWRGSSRNFFCSHRTLFVTSRFTLETKCLTHSRLCTCNWSDFLCEAIRSLIENTITLAICTELCAFVF